MTTKIDINTIDLSPLFSTRFVEEEELKIPTSAADLAEWYTRREEELTKASVATGTPAVLAAKLARLYLSTRLHSGIGRLARAAEHFTERVKAFDDSPVMIWLDVTTPPGGYNGRLFSVLTLTITGSFKNEASYRELLHELFDGYGLPLQSAVREQSPTDIEISYGLVRLQIQPDGMRCKLIATGTKTETIERTIYEVRCDE